MYRIELAPGEETVFRTLEELAIGIRNGLVTSRSRIYHNASEKWLPIAFHPHYKKALQLPVARPSEPSPRGSDKPRMDSLSFAVPAAKKATATPAAEPASAEPAPVDAVPVDAVPSEAAATQTPVVETAAEHPPEDPVLPAEKALDPQVDPGIAVGHDDVPTTAAPATAATLAPVDDESDFDTHHPQTPVAPEGVEPRPEPTFARPAAHHSGMSGLFLPPPSTRPDSYVPSSARLVADDPHAVIAPTTVTLPWAEPPAPHTSPPPSGAVALAPEPIALPTISYPEITPAEPPVVESGGTTRGRRPLQIAVAIAVLAAGGYLAKSFYSPVARRADGSESVQVGRPALPPNAGASTSSAPDASQPVARVVPSPTPTTPTAGAGRASLTAVPAAPASSGFAAALEPRAQAFGPAPAMPPVAGAPTAAVADSSDPAALAPAPAPAPVDVPVLSGVPQVSAPAAKGDSAMKRILRAVSGSKDPKQP